MSAQELPPVEIYSPSTYGAENQNWSISQGENNYLYVANNKGLLEFNGNQWQLYPSYNESILRSVKVIDDKIYSGSYREFGYWFRNELGVLNYSSLASSLNISFLEDEEIWNIIPVDDWILFQSLQRIFIYNKVKNSYSIIDPQTNISKMFKVNESIYYHELGQGIYKIENGKAVSITDAATVKNNRIINMFDKGGDLLIETQDNGFFVLNDSKCVKWEISANKLLSEVSVYSSIQLKDKSFLLGTISNGILHLTSDGKINFEINQANGLGNNTVLSLFEDVDNNIWLALDSGINCINMNSPFKVYNDKEGKLGSVYVSAIYNGNLYLGTNQGLFYKSVDGNEPFTFVEGTQGQVWNLVVLQDSLFCGHNSGTYIINNGLAEKVIDIEGTWNIKTIGDRKDLLLQGNYDGLYVIENKNGKWQLRNKIYGFDISSKYVETYNTNEILVSHEYKGVFKIKVSEDYSSVVEFSRDTLIDYGLNSSLTKYQNDILYAAKEGVFKYDLHSETFKKDSILSSVFRNDNYTSGKLVVDQKTNKLWSFTATGLNYVSPGKLSDVPEINTISFPVDLRNDVTENENIYNINSEKYLLGSSSGYFIIDLDKIEDKSFELNINSIKVTHLNSKNNSTLVSPDETGNFRNKENNIELSFNVPEYHKYSVPEYKYQLIGLYDNWSEWSRGSVKIYEHLPHGRYTFNVKSRIGNSVSSNIATYSFNIERPWALSNMAIGFYVIGLLLISIGTHNIYKSYYTKQREKLLEETKKNLELKELENEQQIMRFKNEHLMQDIGNKNRELAISTMSLIKKNEFLNSIKEELKKVDNGQRLKSVIKIIDKNLNNTDDWKMFEEAFNNADKDFLKKIKTEHSSLTPNDLRLCAYLRLNLTSKEIAPLLNISYRSVEVKRYRLRKKMDLPHEASLTNYILEI